VGEQKMDISGAIARICVEMIEQEEKGKSSTAHSYFDKLLDEKFRFRNARDDILDKKDFLAGLAGRAELGRVFEPPGVDVSYYEDLAVASLLVRIKSDLFRNIRIFGFEANGWRLRMWHNNKIA
jgi:hypothetical protein